MATREELYTALRNADAAGDAEGARKLAAYIQTMPADSAPARPSVSEAEQMGRDRPSKVAVAAGGATSGFGDEVAGAVTATLKGIPGLDRGTEGTTWRQRYEGYRDYLRGQVAGEQERNPLQSIALQSAASLPLMAVTSGPAAAVKGTGMAANALRAAVSGGTSGALSGAGNSRAESAGGVAADAAKEGLLGAALGGVSAPVAAAVGAGGRNVAQRMSNSAAGSYAREKVAEALSRDARGTVVRSAIGDPAAQAAARLGKLGEEARIVDAAGQNSRQLLDTLATLPGATKDAAEAAIRSRQAGRAARLIGAADESLGAGGQRLATKVDDLITQRDAASRPLYAQLYGTSVRPSAALRDIVESADQLGASEVGKKIATARQMPYSLNSSDLQTGAPASMRDVDHLKQGLDTLIAKQWDAQAGKLTPLGGSLQQLKTALIAESDRLTTGANGESLYAAARQAYAGPSALMDAARAGQLAISKGETAIGQATQGLSASELEAFRVGAFDALRNKIGSSDAGRSELMSAWKNPAMQGKLKSLFGDERSYRTFAAAAASEARMKGLESVGRGSQTAARQYGAGDLDVGALGDVASGVGAATSGSLPGIASAAMRTWNRVKTPEPVRDEMGRLLLLQGKAGTGELENLNAIVRAINARRASNAVGAGVAGAMTANQIMQAAGRP